MISSYDNYNILIIEDEPSEQKLLKLCIEKTGLPILIKFISNGEDALKYVEKYPHNEEIISKFHLILIDLNLPRIEGHEILRKLKNNPNMKNTPAVVLTTSNNKTDIEKAYALGAAGYIRKPTLIGEYESAVEDLFRYWFKLCLIP